MRKLISAGINKLQEEIPDDNYLGHASSFAGPGGDSVLLHVAGIDGDQK